MKISIQERAAERPRVRSIKEGSSEEIATMNWKAKVRQRVRRCLEEYQEKPQQEVPIHDTQKGEEEQIGIKHVKVDATESQMEEPKALKEEQEEEEKETFENPTMTHQEGIHILTNPNLQTTDTFDSDEEELFRQIEEETEKEIEIRKKVSQLQPIQVCQCRLIKEEREDAEVSLKSEAHNTSYNDRKLIEKSRENEKNGQSVDYRTGEFVKPDEYTDGHMQILEQKGTCPYMPVKLLENKFDALLDSGSGLSLISRSAAIQLMKSTIWEKLQKEGKAAYKTDLIVNAVNCDGKPINITGRIILPTMSIGTTDLETKCSFWVMESALDEVLIANRWLEPFKDH